VETAPFPPSVCDSVSVTEYYEVSLFFVKFDIGVLYKKSSTRELSGSVLIESHVLNN
jgi:hypothetical protein